MRRIGGIAILTALALAGAVGAAQAQAQSETAQKGRWIHVRVDEQGESGAKVDVNLPLALVQVALEIAEDEKLSGGQIRIDHADVEVADLRRMWNELRAAGDAEFVRAQEKDKTITISQRGNRVLIEVQRADGVKQAHIQVPAAAVDALFSGAADRLNLSAALAQLSDSERGEFIQIDDGESQVRVWID